MADEDRGELEELEQHIAAAEAELKRLTVERASLENDVQRSEHEARAAEARFANVGGEHWQEHETRKARKSVLKARQEEIQAELVELAAGELPLALVADLRASVAEQDRRERQSTEAIVVERLLEERDRGMLAVMEEQRVSAKALKLMRELMEADRRQRAAGTAAGGERRLALSEQAHALLVDLENHALSKRLDDARRLLEQLRQVEHELEEVERSLAATPAEERIKEVAAEFKQASKRATLLEEEARRHDAKLAAAKHARQELIDRQQKLVRKRVQQEIREEETVRMARLAVRTKTTMQEFLRRATAAKIDRLSARVTEAFRFLLRKQTLVEQIMIDPQTFAIRLFGSDGQAIAKQRLSVVREGDRHIFPGRLTRWRCRQYKVRALFAGKMSQSPCCGD